MAAIYNMISFNLREFEYAIITLFVFEMNQKRENSVLEQKKYYC